MHMHHLISAVHVTMAKAHRRVVVLSVRVVLFSFVVVAVLIRTTALSGPGVNLLESDVSTFQQPKLLEPAPRTRHHHQPSLFRLDNPIWPQDPPRVQSSCRVVFRDKTLSVCHILPWANFGDELGPPTVKRILELYFNCSATDLPVLDLAKLKGNFFNRTENQRCLFAVGSLWRMVKTGDHIWGTGAAGDGTISARCDLSTRLKSLKVTNLTIYSSRGPLSARQIQEFCPFANKRLVEEAGDAGFLVPFVFPENVLQRGDLKEHQSQSPRKKVCFIPHHEERGNPQFHVRKSNVLHVGLSWPNMTIALQGCRQVISSSLHGIILAEALGIPNRRMRLTKKPGDLKFADFFLSYRGQDEPSYARNVTSALQSMTQPLPFVQREAYARRILKTFPVHLFETETVGSNVHVKN